MSGHQDGFFSRLCEGLGFVCAAVDTELNVTFWNTAAERQFGRSSDEMIGRPFLEIIREEDRQTSRDCFERTIRSKASVETEVKLPGAERDLLTLVLIISPILDDAGQCVGASAAMRDISQRKRLSQDLARSRRMGALGRMAGGVAHHFNNILGGMLTTIDYVLASDSPRELRKTLRLLAQAIGRATRITNQLAAFAESENDPVEWMELNPLLERFLDRLRPKAGSARIELRTDLEDVRTEPFEAQRLLPVLESLAQNAFDAMPEGGVFSVEMHREGDEAEITLRDSGCGIPPDMMDRLFEPFFTTKGELGGGQSGNIGLGLAVVHGLVAELGGRIQLRSQVGEGTAAILRLPLTEARRRQGAGPIRA